VIAALLLTVAAAAASMEADPLLAALMRDAPGSERAVEKALADPAMAVERRQRLLAGLCQVRGMRGRYAEAADACEEEAKTDKSEADSAKFWRSIVGVPPPRAIGSAVLPAATDRAGLTTIEATINGIAVTLAVDTGAEVSIMPESMARRLGVKPLDAAVRMDTSTVPVNGTLGVVDVLGLGDARVENYVVMILPDKQFDMGEGLQIPPLLGLPMLQAFGRIAWLDGGKRLALGGAVPAPEGAEATPLYWHDDGIGLPVQLARGAFVAHFDTGANRTNLYPDALPLLGEAERASIAVRSTRTGGAGGVLTRQQQHVAKLAATISGVPVRFEAVPVETDLDESGARVGMDYLAQLASLELDFAAMTVRAVPAAAR
jgi:hypothetical protein